MMGMVSFQDDYVVGLEIPWAGDGLILGWSTMVYTWSGLIIPWLQEACGAGGAVGRGAVRLSYGAVYLGNPNWRT